MTEHPLIAFLEARLAEDQAWAEACHGHHWQWVQSDTDEVAIPDPALDEYLAAPGKSGDLTSSSMSLRSVETRMSEPISRAGGLPSWPGQPLAESWPIFHCEEVEATAAGHIVRHDPARVLADIKADRDLITAYREAEAYYAAHPEAPAGEVTGLATALKIRAARFASHPDYPKDQP